MFGGEHHETIQKGAIQVSASGLMYLLLSHGHDCDTVQN